MISIFIISFNIWSSLWWYLFYIYLLSISTKWWVPIYMARFYIREKQNEMLIIFLFFIYRAKTKLSYNYILLKWNFFIWSWWLFSPYQSSRHKIGSTLLLDHQSYSPQIWGPELIPSIIQLFSPPQQIINKYNIWHFTRWVLLLQLASLMWNFRILMGLLSSIIIKVRPLVMIFIHKLLRLRCLRVEP